MNLRQSAKGQYCQLRLPGVCNADPETTVLIHIRRGNVAGIGMKPPDICGVYGCSACHDVVDGRVPSEFTRHELDSYVLDALCRQLKAWLNAGYIAVRV